MPVKKKSKKEPTWDEKGKAVGKKFVKTRWESSSWKKPWIIHENHGGGFGRLLFAMGVLFAADAMGYLQNVSVWVKILIVLGFALMKF